MKKLFALALIGLFSVMVAQAWAAEPGDVGSAECLNVQLEAQEAVERGGPYKNHGQMVSTAAKVVSEYVCIEEVITYECASCIMNQFARRIPIDQQEPCGFDFSCEAQSCGNYTWDCNPARCVCFELAEGGGVCINNFLCAPAEDCPNGTSDCPEGKVCTVNTCCETPKCAPLRCTGEMEGIMLIQGGGTASGN